MLKIKKNQYVVLPRQVGLFIVKTPKSTINQTTPLDRIYLLLESYHIYEGSEDSNFCEHQTEGVTHKDGQFIYHWIHKQSLKTLFNISNGFTIEGSSKVYIPKR